MRTYLECIPCFVRQTLEAVRFASDDEEMQERVVREALRTASEMDLQGSPPEMGQRIHRLIRKLVGSDPYREVKKQSNQFALKLYPALKKMIERSRDSLEAGVRLAIAGNVMDFGISSSLDATDVHKAIEDAMSAAIPIEGLNDFREAVAGAGDILYLADNAGEIVFDRLLIEQMPWERVTVAVRGAPVINDATMDDAQTAGLSRFVEVIDNGSDAPGTILQDCSEGFRERFGKAEVVIAKGQGNYETLSGVEKDIFFMLKVKCPVIAEDVGREVGSVVLQRSDRLAVRAEGGGELAGT